MVGGYQRSHKRAKTELGRVTCRGQTQGHIDNIAAVKHIENCRTLTLPTASSLVLLLEPSSLDCIAAVFPIAQPGTGLPFSVFCANAPAARKWNVAAAEELLDSTNLINLNLGET